jgi:hypothetical protein
MNFFQYTHLRCRLDFPKSLNPGAWESLLFVSGQNPFRDRKVIDNARCFDAADRSPELLDGTDYL